MSKIEAKCIICGGPGLILPRPVTGRRVAVCVPCAESLHPQLGYILEAVRGAPKVKKKVVRRVSPEEFKQILVERVEERGSISVFDLARRHGIGQADARRIAEEAAAEKGWELRKKGKGLLELAKKAEEAAPTG